MFISFVLNFIDDLFGFVSFLLCLVSLRFVSACFVSLRVCFVSRFKITPFPLLINNIDVCLFLDDNVLAYVLCILT
jgi:hypothetical protein